MKRKLTLLYLITFFAIGYSFSQTKTDTLAWVNHTSIKNQQNSGTCWSFGTSSFIESELLRLNPKLKNMNINEMYFVYYNYLNKLQRYYLLTGYMYWTMGGQPHDVMNIIKEHGFITEMSYEAYTAPDKGHDHTLLDSDLVQITQNIDYSKDFSVYQNKFTQVLDKYLGKVPERIIFRRKKYTPKEFSENLNFDPNSYITITSLAHHPYYEAFCLEDKFNWAGELYYNVPWDIFERICDSALYKGYSFVWDGDVSEKGFNYKKGTATTDTNISDVEQERLREFFSHESKIDHVMHVVGLIKKDGEDYYVVKNSWGIIGAYDGYILMSKDYFRLKTIAVTVHVEIITKLAVEENLF